MPRHGLGPSSDEHAEELRKRLRQFMQDERLTVTGWTKRAGVTEGTLRSFLKGGSKTLTHATLMALANAVQEPVMALLAGRSIWGNTTRVEIIAEVSATERANEFIHTSDKAKYSIQVPVPFPDDSFLGAEVIDDSINEKWRKGSVLICAYFEWESKFSLLSEGDFLLIQEKRSQFAIGKNSPKHFFKITVRELLDEDGHNYLMMRSKSPRCRDSIPLHTPIIGTAMHGPFATGLGSEVTVLGKVLAGYTFESAAGGNS
jgi:hypothetical protein